MPIHYPNRPRLDTRLDAVFELRAMPTQVLRKIAVRRGIRATSKRVALMRAIYWDIVNQADVFQSETV